MAAPNTRVQRTRVALRALRGSPLTRHPLGANGWCADQGAHELALTMLSF
jgi:hypothetical protein